MNVWSSEIKLLNHNLNKYFLCKNNVKLTNAEFFELLKKDQDFILFFNQVLADSTFKAFFWEVKPVSESELNEVFEFVLIESNALSSISADSSAFESYFKNHQYVTSFLNLSGESKLVVPVQILDSDCYGHIAKFVRTAPRDQIFAFWQCVGISFLESLGENVKWLSTSGLGIYWLHVRIDSKPKYYNYPPYKLG